MTERIGLESVCSVDGCREAAVNTPRATVAEDVVDAPVGELVSLCARHAAGTDVSEAPSAKP